MIECDGCDIIESAGDTERYMVDNNNDDDDVVEIVRVEGSDDGQTAGGRGDNVFNTEGIDGNEVICSSDDRTGITRSYGVSIGEDVGDREENIEEVAVHGTSDDAMIHDTIEHDNVGRTTNIDPPTMNSHTIEGKYVDKIARVKKVRVPCTVGWFHFPCVGLTKQVSTNYMVMNHKEYDVLQLYAVFYSIHYLTLYYALILLILHSSISHGITALH